MLPDLASPPDKLPTSPIWYLYLIECRDGSYYAGITTDVTRRFEQHLSGKGARYTRSHPPLRLLGAVPCGTRSAALKAEIALKKLTRDRKPEGLATLAGQFATPASS